MKKIAILFSAIAITACSTREDNSPQLTTRNPIIPEIIPIETALSNLSLFLNESYSRSAEHCKIKSIDTHYTKVSDSRGISEIPDAYFVNFEDNSGFAVLGANTAVDDIVLVVENGNIDASSLEISSIDDSYSDLSTLDNFPSYCEEDDDYYSFATINGALVKEFIKCALNDGIYHEGINGSGIGSTTAKPVRYATKQPMINLKWGQSWPYNKYCYGS